MKRDEITRRWEEREKQLDQIRLKERKLEERARKRQRIDDVHGKKKMGEIDEEEEFLIDDWQEKPESTGLGEDAWKAVLEASLLREEAEQELEDEIKVNSPVFDFY
jgi:chromosome transmission fidelity protein 1